MGRKRDIHGYPLGVTNANPLLDMKMYKVELPDGARQEYAANKFSKHLEAQSNRGCKHMMKKATIEHRKDGQAVS